MGVELKKRSEKIAQEEANLDALNNDLEIQLAQTAVDLVGIADPTPISDVIGAGMSLYQGDLIGAGLSLISIIPYAGDALGKTSKGARTAKKINAIRKKIISAIAATNLAKKLGRRSAAAAVRAKRKAEAAKKAAKAKSCKECIKPSNRFGTRLPSDDKGSWSGEKGNSVFTPKQGGKPVIYNDGYPDFSTHAEQSIEIEMDLNGNRGRDFAAADEAVRKKLNNPNWERPEDMVWHHKEDGVTMELIPENIHDPAQHTGGVSIVTDPEY